MSSANPYQSPGPVDVVPLEAAKQPVSPAVLWILGPMIVAGVTGIAAALVGLVAIVAWGWNVDFEATHPESPPKAVMYLVMAMFSGIVSLLPGLVLGLTAVAAALARRRAVRLLTGAANALVGMATCALSGAAVGFWLVFIQFRNAPAGDVFAWWMGLPAGAGVAVGLAYAAILASFIRWIAGAV